MRKREKTPVSVRVVRVLRQGSKNLRGLSNFMSILRQDSRIKGLIRYTGEKIIQELRRWHVFKGEFIDREFISVPPPSSLVQEVLPEIGIPLPPKLLPVR